MGASKLAMSSTRVMGTCAIGGQAIGTAAAMLCSQNAENIRNISITELQQNLLRDDCYLPMLVNQDNNDFARNAKITASSEEKDFPAKNLISGVTRSIDGECNAWFSLPLKDEQSENVILSFEKELEVNTVQLVFDSDFNTEKKITLSSTRQNQQKIGVPAELVRDFSVELIKSDAVVEKFDIKDNCQRLVKLNFNSVFCDTVKINFTKTWGDLCVKVFEIRVY